MATKFPGVALRIFADQELPEGLLDKALEAHSDIAGVAVVKQEDDDGNELSYLGTYLTRDSTEVTAQQIGVFLDQNKNKERILFLGSMPDKAKDENMQPFVALFDDEGETTVAAFLLGDFEKKAKDEREHSHSRQVFDRIICPLIAKTNKANEDDPGKAFSDLASDPSTPEFLNIVPDTEVILVSNEGIASFGDLSSLNQFEWGHTSDLCGWEAPAAKKEAKTGFGNKRNPDTNVKPKTETSSVALPDKGKDGKPPVTQGPGAEGKDWKWYTAPSEHSKGQKEKDYMEQELWTDAGWKKGIKPQNFKDSPRVRVRIKAAIIKDFKDIDPKAVKTADVTDEALPVISPNSKTYIRDTLNKRGHVQKTLNEGKVTLDPNRMKKLAEDEWPTFVEDAGMDKLEATMSYLHEDKIDMCKRAPDAAAKLIEDLQLALYNLDWKKRVKNNQLIFADPKDEEPEEKVEEQVEEKQTGTGGFGKKLAFKK